MSIVYSKSMIMRQRTQMKQKTFQKDYGSDLFHAVLFLLALFTILWYLKI